MKNFNFSRYLSVFLWLVAFHSLCVGVGLIVVPCSFMQDLGYGICSERFFRSQGGVFHIVMAVGYSMAAFNSKRFECLVIFSVIVKFIAAVFLFYYYFIINPLIVIILSCVSDLIMGAAILSLYLLSKKTEQNWIKNE
ncbi:MAG: hypothetical protein KJ571_10020 [Bacteroidetes bacterium]|nr:hypothetical protein [Bacteroidota bacterium]